MDTVFLVGFCYMSLCYGLKLVYVLFLQGYAHFPVEIGKKGEKKTSEGLD